MSYQGSSPGREGYYCPSGYASGPGGASSSRVPGGDQGWEQGQGPGWEQDGHLQAGYQTGSGGTSSSRIPGGDEGWEQGQGQGGGQGGDQGRAAQSPPPEEPCTICECWRPIYKCGLKGPESSCRWAFCTKRLPEEVTLGDPCIRYAGSRLAEPIDRATGVCCCDDELHRRYGEASAGQARVCDCPTKTYEEAHAHAEATLSAAELEARLWPRALIDAKYWVKTTKAQLEEARASHGYCPQMPYSIERWDTIIGVNTSNQKFLMCTNHWDVDICGYDRDWVFSDQYHGDRHSYDDSTASLG